jgi:hypothetical protein
VSRLRAIPPLPRDPRTPREWQAAADAAYLMLTLDSCRQYGLIEGGPEIDCERCEAILERAAKKGIKPAELKC